MVEKTDDLYLNHIRDACRQIIIYLKDINRNDFESSKLAQDATIKELEIIGEAARKLSVESKNKFKSVDWEQIIGMRDKLIHNYTGIDLDVVWKTANDDVPKLLKNLQD